MSCGCGKCASIKSPKGEKGDNVINNYTINNNAVTTNIITTKTIPEYSYQRLNNASDSCALATGGYSIAIGTMPSGLPAINSIPVSLECNVWATEGHNILVTVLKNGVVEANLNRKITAPPAVAGVSCVDIAFDFELTGLSANDVITCKVISSSDVVGAVVKGIYVKYKIIT